MAALAGNGVIFQDDFTVSDVNPEGAKFEKVDRLVCKGVVYELEFMVDVNSEVFDVQKGEKLSVAIATSLSIDGTPDAGDSSDYTRIGGKPSLLDQFDYARCGAPCFSLSRA